MMKVDSYGAVENNSNNNSSSNNAAAIVVVKAVGGDVKEDESRPLLVAPADRLDEVSGKKKGICKRLKLWHKLCLGLVGFVLFSVIFWFAVMIPVITHEAQKQIDLSMMTFKTLLITNADSDSCELKSTNVITNAQVRAGRMYGTYFDATFQGETFASLYTKDLDITGAGEAFPMDSVLHIHDHGVFHEFMRAAIMDDSISLDVKGNVKLGVLWKNRVWFSVNVKMDKSSAMKGCGGLQNGQVVSFKPLVTAAGLGAQVAIQLFNPSIVTIHPLGGYMQLNLMYNGTQIGSGISYGDAKIGAGLNTIVADGTLDVTCETWPYVWDMVTRWIEGHNSTMGAKFGANATGVELYNPALDGIVLQTNFPGFDWGSNEIPSQQVQEVYDWLLEKKLEFHL